MSQAGVTNLETSNPEIPIIFQADVGTATAVANVIEIRGGIDAVTTASGNTITINSNAGGFVWQTVTSADNPVTFASGTGFICKGAAQVVFSLPPAASVGNVFRIVGHGNLWTIQQNAAQSISIGTATSTLGVGGSVTASTVSDGIELVCVTANLEFYEISIQGNPTIL